MQSITQPSVAHEIESAGVDWITATAQKGGTRIDMMEFTRTQRERFMDAGATIKMGYRLGYYGWQTDGFFHGQREGGSIIVASGAVAHDLHKSVANVSDHISRLDLQVTVTTPVERPNLAAQAYGIIKSGSPAKVRMKNATYIETHPQGATLNLGKRTSDGYGRLYDKATESGLGAARSRWRYEIELKRHPANATATTLRRFESAQVVASQVVHAWFTARGVAPIFTPDTFSCPHEPSPTRMKRDVLLWFEQSLSVTVSKAVRYHGLPRVLEALGLLRQVEANYERRTEDAGRYRRSIQTDGEFQSTWQSMPADNMGEGEGDRPTPQPTGSM